MNFRKIKYLIIALFVFISSVLTPYTEVMAFDIPTAFWGVLESGRAMFTAMTAGGAYKNGIDISSFERSSRQDFHDFQTQILIGYQAFCIYKEKIKLALENPNMSQEDINTQATSSGTSIKESFENNAINVNNTTNSITRTEFSYWKEYCDNVSYIARNGLGSGGSGSIGYPVILNNINYSLQGNTNVNSDYLFEYNGNTYSYGLYYRTPNEPNTQKTWYTGSVPTDRVRIPYVWLQFQNNKWYFRIKGIDVRRLDGSVIAVSDYVSNDNLTITGDTESVLQTCINNTDFPVCITGLSYPSSNTFYNEINSNYATYLPLVNESSNQEEAYKTLIGGALDNTEFGKALKNGTGSRAEVVGENAIPVKRSSVIVGEETATGVIGWDIPDTTTLEGSIAVPQDEDEVIKGMGIITVPAEETITDGVLDDVVVWPKDVPITIPEEEEETDSVPITDVISVQGGEYYPTQVDITEFFPFCIPFDIAYCIGKFQVGTGEAPILHIPIVYPTILQSSLGESYDVIIDFNDYISLRNIIRYFILLLFLAGLMKLTRDIIRG